MKRPTPRSAPWTRLSFAVTCLGLALLLWIPTPASLLWMLAIVLEGWAHGLAAMALLALWPGWRRTWQGKVAAVCAVVAALLALAPAVRAIAPAERLVEDLPSSFGVGLSGATPTGKKSAFSISHMLIGVWPAPVPVETVVYRQLGDVTLRLDIYRPPASSRPVPLVVTIHGGAWHHGDRTQLSAHNHRLAAMGYVVAAIDYRLAPQWKFPTALEDVRAALAFLRHESHRYGFDPDRVVLHGRSAGAHLALLAAYRLRDPGIAGVVALYPPVDLEWGYRNPTNPWVLDSVATLEEFLGGSPAEVPNNYRAASPHLFVSKDAPPTLLLHGQLDEFVAMRHSRVLVERLRQVGVPHLLVTIPGGHHAFDLVPGSPGGQMATYAYRHFLSVVTDEGHGARSKSPAPDRVATPAPHGQNGPPSWSPRTEH